MMGPSGDSKISKEDSSHSASSSCDSKISKEDSSAKLMIFRFFAVTLVVFFPTNGLLKAQAGLLLLLLLEDAAAPRVNRGRFLGCFGGIPEELLLLLALLSGKGRPGFRSQYPTAPPQSGPGFGSMLIFIA
jgi:hypothetical protein